MASRIVRSHLSQAYLLLNISTIMSFSKSIVVQGGIRLVGDVRVSGSKHAALHLLGAALIAGESVVFENFPDIAVEMLDFSNLMLKPGHFALKVRGHSMIEALIDDGDMVIMQPVTDQKTVKNGAIVAAHVGGKTTLKYYHKKGAKVVLMPGNPDRILYPETELKAIDVELQGLLVAVWRDYK